MAKPRDVGWRAARTMFPGAIEALEADGADPREYRFWVDVKGRLHVDDAIHPAFDDVWDADRRAWFGDDSEEDSGPDDDEVSREAGFAIASPGDQAASGYDPNDDPTRHGGIELHEDDEDEEG